MEVSAQDIKYKTKNSSDVLDTQKGDVAFFAEKYDSKCVSYVKCPIILFLCIDINTVEWYNYMVVG